MTIEHHALIARTHGGLNFRVMGLSDWTNAQRRFNTATQDGRATAITVHAFVEGRWQNLTGHLCVRSASDPLVIAAPIANDRKRGGPHPATVRAAS